MNFATRAFYMLATLVAAATLWMLTIPSAKAATLQEHIDTYCKTKCVSAEILTEVTARAAKRYGFDQRSLIAIIFVESKYHIRAKNGTSVGLTQVLLKYHRPKFMGRDHFAVEDNVFAGGQVFSDCLKKHKGSYATAFSCYNGYGSGDNGYRQKVLKALAVIRGLELPTPSKDPLGEFIARL